MKNLDDSPFIRIESHNLPLCPGGYFLHFNNTYDRTLLYIGPHLKCVKRIPIGILLFLLYNFLIGSSHQAK